MDLWIRSQDRKRLIPNPNLYVVESEAGISYVGDTMVGHIGNYKNLERALEVLDEIQGKIAQNECLNAMIPKVTDIRGYEEFYGKLFKDTIYQMPKD